MVRERDLKFDFNAASDIDRGNLSIVAQDYAWFQLVSFRGMLTDGFSHRGTRTCRRRNC